MKQKDIALIAVVAIVSGAVSFFVAQYFFLKPESKQIKAEYVQAITTDFSQPNTKYFNQKSINPTQQIQIGGGGNTSPYNATSQ